MTGFESKRSRESSCAFEGIGFAVRIDGHAKRFPGLHVEDADESERWKGPFDGGAFRIGDAFTKRDVNDDRVVH